jgi:glycosyltransferase involved in cell wall biosynthesis/MoaA/NifB/PqqE/SkfB family radical SAM enzyme
MKVLLVIHGYPMRYNAGSEVYTQGLAQALAERHEVHVFTRQQNKFVPDYVLSEETDPLDARVKLHVINLTQTLDQYRHVGVDRQFGALLDALKPDVVHIGHLNHISTSLVLEASRRNIPLVYTLHDYWLMCPRGQFIQIRPKDQTDLWPLCDGQEDRKCAEQCYARYFSGAPEEEETDIAYWTDWVHRRMTHIREVCGAIDLFIAPSRYLLQRFRDEFHLPNEKLVYLDYGFQHQRFQGRNRVPGEPFTFGYIGTHIPAKGINHLIEAFRMLSENALLRIWGRPLGVETEGLLALVRTWPRKVQDRIEWMGEYQNQDIVRDVFNRCDAIVVPSIWVENAPLVIHEALQARVPVITADAGGMAEYVHHEQNGLLFTHRNPQSLAEQMQRFVDNPAEAAHLGKRGYLSTSDKNIPEMSQHVQAIEAYYAQLLARKRSQNETPPQALGPGPWRITFDTNPDDCNLHCIMCEEHSPFSTLQSERIAAGRPKRRMDIMLIRRVLEESRGTPLREIIPSTMGEPLVYKHMDEIIDLCSQYGVKLNLTTNGTFPGRGARAWAERIVPVASDVKISWNGARKETHQQIMLGTRWEKVLENAKIFLQVRDTHAARGGNRCRVTFQLTFLETNVDELADIVKLAASLGVDRVKGHHLWAHFDEIKPLSMRRSPESIMRWNRAVQLAYEAVEQYRLPSGNKVLLENIFPLEHEAQVEIAPGAVCPFLGKEAWVSAEGRFNPCCAPDALRRTLGEFGNLNEQSLYNVWQSPAYRTLQGTYLNHSLCRGCNMRRPEQV